MKPVSSRCAPLPSKGEMAEGQESYSDVTKQSFPPKNSHMSLTGIMIYRDD